MYLYDIISKKQHYLILLILSILTFFSVNRFIYIYDGHHHGLMLSNALELLSGKVPFKEIFIQYGILTTLLHAGVIFFFGEKLLYLNIFTILLYYSSVYLIFLIVKFYTNLTYAFLGLIILLLNHPTPWIPWANYISFFFITLGVYFNTKDSKLFFFLSGILFGLSVLSRFDYFLAIFLTLIIHQIFLYFLNKNKNVFKNYSYLLFGFILTLMIFLTYLNVNNLYIYWIKYLYLPSLYLDETNSTIISYFLSFLNYFSYEWFFNFIINPQASIIAFIIFFNIIFFLNKTKNSNPSLLFISILAVLLCSVSISTELFRLYTSVSIGLITSLFILYNIKDNNSRKIFSYILILISLFSFIFYPEGNTKRLIIDKNNYTFTKTLNPIFSFQKWPESHVRTLNFINDIKTKVTNKCNIRFGENLTFDNFYSIELGLDRVRVIPHVKSDIKNTQLSLFFDNTFLEKINSLIANQEIIILVTEKNDEFSFGKVKYTSSYTFKTININDIKEKPKSLRIYYPKNCLN